MKPVDHPAIIYRYLVENAIPKRVPATYEEVCGVIGLTLDQAFNYISGVLERIFVACDEKGLPPLTSIVVGKETRRGRHGMPGAGYLVAEAVSANKAKRERASNYELFHPDYGLSIDQKEALKKDFTKMIHAHQDSVWYYTAWPKNL